MPKLSYNISTQYNDEFLYNIVADIESYPIFIPWVVGARILNKDGNQALAELLIKYKFFRSSYVSKVNFCSSFSEIKVELDNGPFKYLKNHWKFNKGNVEFLLDFELNSNIFNQLISEKFDSYAKKMMDAFLHRANSLAT